MESESEGFVNLLTADTSVKEVLLDIVTNGEEVTTSRVRGGIYAIGASNPLYDSS